MNHAVDIEYTYGFIYNPRAVCACGWHGPTRALSVRARIDANKHWRANNSWSGGAS